MSNSTFAALHARYSPILRDLTNSPSSGLGPAMVAAVAARRCYAAAMEHAYEVIDGACQDDKELGEEFRHFAAACVAGSVVHQSSMPVKFSELMGSVTGGFAHWMAARAGQLRDEFSAANAVDVDEFSARMAGQTLPLPECFTHVLCPAGQTATFHVPLGRAGDVTAVLAKHFKDSGLKTVVFSAGEDPISSPGFTCIPRSVWEKSADKGGFAGMVAVASALHRGEVDVFLVDSPQLAMTPAYSFQPAARVAAALNKEARKFAQRLGRWAVYVIDQGYGEERESEDFADLRTFSVYERPVSASGGRLLSGSGVTIPLLSKDSENGES